MTKISPILVTIIPSKFGFFYVTNFDENLSESLKISSFWVTKMSPILVTIIPSDIGFFMSPILVKILVIWRNLWFFSDENITNSGDNNSFQIWFFQCHKFWWKFKWITKNFYYKITKIGDKNLLILIFIKIIDFFWHKIGCIWYWILTKIGELFMWRLFAPHPLLLLLDWEEEVMVVGQPLGRLVNCLDWIDGGLEWMESKVFGVTLSD